MGLNKSVAIRYPTQNLDSEKGIGRDVAVRVKLWEN